METLSMPYLLPLLLLLPLSLYLIFFIGKKGSGDRGKLLPGSEGWPIFGENVELSRSGFQQFMRDRMQKYSPHIFKTSLMGEKMVALCGPEGNKFIFRNGSKHLTRWTPVALRRAMYPTLAEVRHNEITGVFPSDIVKPEALRLYLPVMDNLAREHLRDGGHWRPDSVAKAHPLTKKYALELVCKIFMDVVDPERVGTLLEPLSLLTKGLLSQPINLPGTAFNRALRGGRELRAVLVRFVEERRNELKENKESEGRDDLVSKMVAVTDNDSIVNLIAGLLIAGQYEVSSALTVVIHFLAKLPHIYEQVFNEQMEIAKSKGPDEMLTWEDLDKMKYTWNVVRESLRILPPVIGGFGEVTTEFTYAGFTIPKGWKTFWTVHTSHMNPDYFPEPEKFDPLRFEGSGPAPYTFVPFGGGPRMCPGIGYTKLVLLVFIHNLVTRFRFEKVIPNEKMLFHGSSSSPAHGLPLHLYPHKN